MELSYSWGKVELQPSPQMYESDQYSKLCSEVGKGRKKGLKSKLWKRTTVVQVLDVKPAGRSQDKSKEPKIQ